jgi:hypothetical protein
MHAAPPEPSPSSRFAQRSRSLRRALARFARAALPYVALALVLDAVFVWRILDLAHGQLCPTLDDAYIHLEYARSLVELRPLSYNPGDAPTTGATSFLYIALLALGWAVGFRGLGALAFMHALGVIALAITAWCGARIAERLVGPTGRWAGLLAVLVVPQYVFEALGGMEIALVTATQLLAVLAALEWTLRPRAERTLRFAWLVCGAGMLASASRPEGIAAAGAVALTLLVVPGARPRGRALAVLAVLPTTFPGLVAWITTGQSRTTGQLAKWMFASPYLDRQGAIEGTVRNLLRLWNELLAGSHGGFVVPHELRALLVLGALALAIGLVRRHGLRGTWSFAILAMATAAIAIPATYWTFDTNRGRYLWPFVPLVMLVAVMGAVVLGRALARSRLRWHAAPVALAAGTLVFACRGPIAALDRVADSASEICAQQVAMAARVRELPPGTLAVNDAGALRHLTDRRIYDLVGLTTPNAAIAWNSGIGSVLERLEHEPEALRPRYVAFHPNWLSFPLAGELIHAIRVEDANHVGGEVMELRAIRTELYRSGDRPAIVEPEGELVDELDMADLESERAHAYVFAVGTRGNDFARVFEVGERSVADGGRLLLGEERFELRASPGREATLVTRIEPRASCTLRVEWNGVALEAIAVEEARGWHELSIAIPTEHVQRVNRVARRCTGTDAPGVFHDWLYQPR